MQGEQPTAAEIVQQAPAVLPPGARRRYAKRVARLVRSLEHTKRLAELGVIDVEETAERINRIRTGEAL